MTRRFEALIIGAGPAGLSAAVELANSGIKAAVVDENPDVGGQVYRQPPSAFTISDEKHPYATHQFGHSLIKSFKSQSEKITTIHESYIWGLFDNESLAIFNKGEIELVQFDKLILCEGALERSIPFPGWTLPGIMTAGGLQKLVKSQRLLPGKRFLLAGCSPLLLSVAGSLVSAGAEFVGMCDATTFMENLRLVPEILSRRNMWQETICLQSQLLRRAAKVYRPYSIVSADGDSRVRTATIARLDKKWMPIPGSEIQIAIDIVGLGFGFLPHARLARLCGCSHVYDSGQKCWKPKTDQYMRSSKQNIYVAGDSSGIGGADNAGVEGRIAGIHAAFELGKISQTELSSRMDALLNEKQRNGRYALLLNQIFAPRDGLYNILDGDTVICRCEGVAAKEIMAGIELGARNINMVKRTTRSGMGLCQGRTCESIITQLMLQRNIPIEDVAYLNLRPPLSPMPLDTFITSPV